MKTKRITLKEILKKEMQDTEFVSYFNQQKTISEIARLVRDTRFKAGLTQIELAKRAKTGQSVIARLESGRDQRTPTLDLLGRIAKALKAKLKIGLSYESDYRVNIVSNAHTEKKESLGKVADISLSETSTPYFDTQTMH